MKILVVNPGSTSTKMAVFEDTTPILIKKISHDVSDLSEFPRVTDQFRFRKELILEELRKHQIPFEFDAVIGRGGLVKPISGGVYIINEVMRQDTLHAKRDHACNLGCLIAAELAGSIPACKAFIADPGVVDELADIARISGSPLLPRISIFHALNQKAIARRHAAEHDKRYEDLNLIVCHLGGGISVGAHQKGRVVDVNNVLDGEGPFSPERAGTLPAGQLVDLCFSGQYSREDLKKRISGQAGLAAHLGTTDVEEIIDRIKRGDQKAKLVLDAMIYNAAKQIGALSTVFKGDFDAIILTGGIAHSTYVVEGLQERIQFLAPVFVYPGEDEMEALAMNAYGALKGTLPVIEYK
ncbi:MAG: butyrate kinase [Bacteroides sp.]